MSNAASNYVENRTLDFWLNGNSLTTTSPSNLYVALFHGTAADVLGRLEAGTLTDEISQGSYARTEVTFGSASGGQIANDANVTFPTATANYNGSVTCIAVMDASTSGNCLFAGQLTVAKTVTIGDVFQIATNNLTVSLT